MNVYCVTVDEVGQRLFFNINKMIYVKNLTDKHAMSKRVYKDTSLMRRAVYCRGSLYVTQGHQYGKPESGLVDLQTRTYKKLSNESLLFAPMGDC